MPDVSFSEAALPKSSPNILFAISDTGGGHRAAALAIVAALEQLAGPAINCRIVDLLVHSGVPFFRTLPDRYYDLSTRLLPLNNLVFELTDGPRRVGTIMQMVSLSADPNIRQVLEQSRPSLVVSLHPLASRLIGNARRTYRLPFRLVTVVTELVRLHAAWADPQADLCVVPTAEAYRRLQQRGIPTRQLVCTGFPVHPKFGAYNRTRQEARRALGIAQAPFTVLVASGAAGAGNMRELVIALDRAYPQQQFLVVTGKNAALRAELDTLGLNGNMRIYGFADNMEVLMAASDCIVTKAGPGTLMEALAMRRPVIITQAVGAQEQGTIDFVLNHELGVFCPTSDQIIPALAELIDPAIYAATAARLAAVAPNSGASQIARILLDQPAPPGYASSRQARSTPGVH
jgi:UDP-N-acetylglucosamine:LPS N-acetylglucosamine transferase